MANYKPTAKQNLITDLDTGIYYARCKVGGMTKMRSLETTVATTAKLRLQDKLKEIRESVPQEAPIGGLDVKSTFGDVANAYKQESKELPRLSQATLLVRVRPLATLRRTWPEVFEMEIRHITTAKINSYMSDYEKGKWPYLPPRAKAKTRAGNAASTVNKMVACLRNVFDLAVRSHVITKNPAAELTYTPVKKKLLQLPNRPQFAKLVEHIRRAAGKGRIAGDLVEGLAFSGLRVKESGGLEWQHLDHERRMTTVKGTKTEGSARIIPMTEAFYALTLRMKAHREKLTGAPVNPQDTVFEAKEATMSLANACKAVGVKKLTHHDLRHLFATTCIESGVDIPTVSGWLGHVDGGTLAMSTYGHIRPSHSSEAARKVRF